MVDFSSDPLASQRARRLTSATLIGLRRFPPSLSRIPSGRPGAVRWFSRRGVLPRVRLLPRNTENRSTLMFENRKEQMEILLKGNEDFRRIFNHHQQLEKRVTAAENGTAPMEDLALNQLKREKLRAKDQLSRIMDQAQAVA
jgi:uncharacterized protein